MIPFAVTGNEMRLVFVGVIGSPKYIEVHNDGFVVRVGIVVKELHSALRVIDHTAASLCKRANPFGLAVFLRGRQKAPSCQALDNEPHGS